MTERHAMIDGLRFAYRFEGPEDAPAVMLCNSLASDMTMWDSQLPELAGRYRVLRYDRRGHGRTEASPPPYSIERLAGDALALLNLLRLERVHFVGLSLGGMVGQYLGRHRPDRLRSLTLAATSPHMPPPEMWQERVAIARNAGITDLVDLTLERWFTAGFRDRHGDRVDRVRRMIQGTSVDGYAGCCLAIAEMDQRADVGGIRTPTLIIVGREDPATPVSVSEFMHGTIEGSELAVIEDAAHLVNIEQPDAFNTALLGFLARH